MIFEEEMPDIRKMPVVFGGNVKLEDIVGRDRPVIWKARRRKGV